MIITITDISHPDMLRKACDMTRKPGMKPSQMTREKIYQCEHSPVRMLKFFIEIRGVPSFVSTHLVRHKFGAEHFVESNRDDRGGAGDDVVTRMTPVNHGIEANAQAIINISKKRLCYASHRATVATWSRVRKAMRKVDPDLANAMVPECVVRGYCPELRECGPGLQKVLAAYADSQPAKLRAKAATIHTSSTTE